VDSTEEENGYHIGVFCLKIISIKVLLKHKARLYYHRLIAMVKYLVFNSLTCLNTFSHYVLITCVSVSFTLPICCKPIDG